MRRQGQQQTAQTVPASPKRLREKKAQMGSFEIDWGSYDKSPTMSIDLGVHIRAPDF